MRSRIGESSTLPDPATREKLESSVIRDEVYFPGPTEFQYDVGEWGKHVFGA